VKPKIPIFSGNMNIFPTTKVERGDDISHFKVFCNATVLSRKTLENVTNGSRLPFGRACVLAAAYANAHPITTQGLLQKSNTTEKQIERQENEPKDVQKRAHKLGSAEKGR